MMKAILILLGVMASVTGLYAEEPQTVMLWPDGVPGFAEDHQHKPIVFRDPEHITEVSQPFMRVFPADPEKATGQAMLVFPGGGYSILAHLKCGDRVAKRFADAGVTCFVVCYRVTSARDDRSYQFPGPLLDARQAMRLVKKNAASYQIDPDRVGVIGFSAGGHLAAMCATRYNDELEGEPSSDVDVRPAFAALIYPVASLVHERSHGGSKHKLFGANPEQADLIAASPEKRLTKDTPPLFIVHNQFDPVSSLPSLALTEAATVAGVPCELHLYPQRDHGFGMGRPGATEENAPIIVWPALLEKFIKRQK